MILERRIRTATLSAFAGASLITLLFSAASAYAAIEALYSPTINTSNSGELSRSAPTCLPSQARSSR